jgi:hypothetical protein
MDRDSVLGLLSHTALPAHQPKWSGAQAKVSESPYAHSHPVSGIKDTQSSQQPSHWFWPIRLRLTAICCSRALQRSGTPGRELPLSPTVDPCWAAPGRH